MAVMRIASLEKSFGDVRAVRDLSLSVEAGDLYGLLGPNGSGKTTTLACALGLLPPDAGTVEVLGVPAARIHETAGRIAVVFDGTTLVPGLSVRQNLTYAQRLLGHAGGRQPDEALRLVDLAGRDHQRASRLSLGQKRRLAIARALLGRPELLVLDEPLSGLDALGVVTMLDLFRRLREDGITLLLSTHRLHEMEQVVSKVAIIIDGRLAVEGDLTTVLGGDEPTLSIRLDRADEARAVLEALPDVGTVTVLADDQLRVGATPASAAAINSALVRSGFAISELRPERRSLQATFESLVTERRAAAQVVR